MSVSALMPDVPDADVAANLPVYALPAGSGLVIKRKRGRPPKIRPAPDASQAEYLVRIHAKRQAFIEADPLVGATKTRRPDAGTDILWMTLAALAEEQASLRFDLEHGALAARQCTQARSRRVSALGAMASIVLALRRHCGDQLNVRGTQAQAVYRLFVEQVATVAEGCLPQGEAAALMVRLRARLAGWESVVESDRLR